jgi:hypothetical protein
VLLEGIDRGAPPIANVTEEHLGQRMALYHITVVTDAGDLVASCHGVVYRKEDQFPESQPRGANLVQIALQVLLCYTHTVSDFT